MHATPSDNFLYLNFTSMECTWRWLYALRFGLPKQLSSRPLFAFARAEKDAAKKQRRLTLMALNNGTNRPMQRWKRFSIANVYSTVFSPIENANRKIEISLVKCDLWIDKSPRKLDKAEGVKSHHWKMSIAQSFVDSSIRRDSTTFEKHWRSWRDINIVINVIRPGEATVKTKSV